MLLRCLRKQPLRWGLLLTFDPDCDTIALLTKQLDIQMKTVARFVTRLQGEGDGMFIGAVFHAGKDSFKPNTVYEIREVLGALTIVEVGQGIGAGPDNCSNQVMSDGKNPFHWAEDIGHIIACQGRLLFLTMQEYITYVDDQRKKYLDYD